MRTIKLIPQSAQEAVDLVVPLLKEQGPSVSDEVCTYHNKETGSRCAFGLMVSVDDARWLEDHWQNMPIDEIVRFGDDGCKPQCRVKIDFNGIDQTFIEKVQMSHDCAALMGRDFFRHFTADLDERIRDFGTKAVL